MSRSNRGGEARLTADDLGGPGGLRGLETRSLGLLVTLAGLAAALVYDYQYVAESQPLLLDWDVTQMDWLLLVSLALLGFYVVAPLVQNRRLTRLYWRRLRRRPLAVASLGYLSVFFFLGLFGPVLFGRPEFLGAGSHQPPAFMSVDADLISTCMGRVTNGRCHGTLAHPLGTSTGNHDMLVFVINGMRVALQVALITATILVPLATAVGTAAAQFGGWVDEVLMRYVDIQQTVPPFFVYIIAQYVLGPSLLLIVTVFGVLNWGGTARLVRSEALARREAPFMLAAREAGSSSLRTVRKHLVPNVSNTVITAVTLQMPSLIIIEVTLSFLGIGAPDTWSWGILVISGMEYFPTFWWVTAVPMAVILVTVVAFYVLGDALRDVLDPRTEATT